MIKVVSVVCFAFPALMMFILLSCLAIGAFKARRRQLREPLWLSIVLVWWATAVFGAAVMTCAVLLRKYLD